MAPESSTKTIDLSGGRGNNSEPETPISTTPKLGDRWRPFPATQTSAQTLHSRAHPQDDVRAGNSLKLSRILLKMFLARGFVSNVKSLFLCVSEDSHKCTTCCKDLEQDSFPKPKIRFLVGVASAIVCWRKPGTHKMFYCAWNPDQNLFVCFSVSYSLNPIQNSYNVWCSCENPQ